MDILKIFGDIAGGMIGDIGGEFFNLFINEVFSVLIAIAIPGLVIACIKCFFGYRFSKYLLTLDGVIYGGILGAIVFSLIFKSQIGFVLGGLVGAVGGGFLVWNINIVGICWLGFRAGILVGFGFTALLQGSFKVGLVIGIICGIGLGVLFAFYVKISVMVATSVMGAGGIALFIMLLDRFSPTIKIVGILMLIALSMGGYYIQHYGENKRGIPMKDTVKREPEEVPVMNKQPVSHKIVGIEGRYKGFEFDVDSDVTFGRDEERCNVIFPKESKGVSRIQCVISLQPNGQGISICDDHSSFGTSVNGQKIATGKTVALNIGDIILFGENNIFKLQS